MKRYVLDSFSVIAFFEDDEGSDFVADILREIVDGRAEGYMSVINWGEVLYNIMREQGADAAARVLRKFDTYPIRLIPADRDRTREAATLKAQFRIAYADCFVAALAREMNAPVVTGDPEFGLIEKICAVAWAGQEGRS